MIQFLTEKTYEKKIYAWATKGLLVFISALFWAPSRDGLQAVYLLAFFLPMLLILPFRKPTSAEYGGWITITALLYAGFSTLSALWSEHPEDFYFFVLQWCVLATWLCGSCLIFSKNNIDIEKYIRWFVIAGVITTISLFLYHFITVEARYPMLFRFHGWNVFRNPNELGSFCGIIALLAFTIAIQSSSLKRTLLFYALSLLPILGMVSSLSRGAFLAFILMAALALIIVRPSFKVWLLPVLIAVTTLVIALSYTDILTSYTSGRGEGFGQRSDIWKEVLNRSRDNFFIGVGMTKDTNINVPAITIFSHAHNAWLDTLYRSGLIGLILVLLHLTTVSRQASRDPVLLPLFLWLGYGCVCHLFDGRCFFWEIGAKWFLYWIPTGLIAAITTRNYINQSYLTNHTTPSKPTENFINQSVAN